MTTVVYEEIRGGAFDYGGDPPAPTAIRLRVVQFFDDTTSRDVWRTVDFGSVFADWDAALLAQRDAVAADAGAKAVTIQTLTAERDALAAQLAQALLERDQIATQLAQVTSERDRLAAELAAAAEPAPAP